MTRVFILEPVQFNVENVKKFGEVVYIFSNFDRRPSIWAEEYAQTVVDVLESKHFNPEEDVFLAAGKMVPIAIVIAELVMEYDGVRLLLFNAVSPQHYVIHTVE